MSLFGSFPLFRKNPRASYRELRRRFRPTLESLEDRRMLTFDPSGIEQEMLEFTNRMRADPAGELERLFLSLDESDPNYFVSPDADVNIALTFFGTDDGDLISQWASLTTVAAPVAWNSALYDAAEAHNQEMIDADTQSHQLPGEESLLTRAVNAGYNWSGSVSVGENVFAYTESVFHGHAAFAIDWGNTPNGIQDPAGHRLNILEPDWQEVGISIVSSSGGAVGPLVVTQDFGFRGNYGDAKVLGVVFTDGDGDDFYDAGEGEAGVTITVSDGLNTYSTTTMTAGGYQMAVPAGTYDVTASGGSLSGVADLGSITVSADNYKLDLETSSIPAVTAATISGVVFDDVDENGSFSSGDSFLSGVTVYLDANDNGDLDGGEESTTTDVSGAYSFSTTDFRTHTVAFEMPADMRLSSAGVSTHTVTVNDGDSETDLNFALHAITPATISGVVFNDADEDGAFSSGDAFLSGVTVYLDANGDGDLDGDEASTTTDVSGAYSFSTTDFGTHTVAFVMPADTGLSSAGVSTHTVTVNDGDSETGLDFALLEVVPATISGTVFNDADEDGAFSSGDAFLSGVTVYLDANGDGDLDGGEASTTTDVSGAYSFSTTDFGTRTVAFVMPADTGLSSAGVSTHTVTVGEGDSETGLDFALLEITPATISGIVFDDVNEDGAFGSGDSFLSSVTVYLDANDNGDLDGGEESTTTDVSGAYSFSTTDFGTHTVAFVMPADTRLSSAGVGTHTVSVADGDAEAGIDFALFEITPATISGIVYNDADEDGFFSTGDTLLSGVTVYLDANGNGDLDGGEVFTSTNVVGAYSFSTTDFGTHTVAYEMPSNTTISPAGVSTHTVTVGDGDTETGRNFALLQGNLTLTVSGTAGSDTFTFTDNGATFDVTVNGTTNTYVAADYATIHFDGLGAEDTLNLNAGSNNESATINEGTMSLVSDAGWEVNGENFENVNVDLGTGDSDFAYLYDGAQDDDLISHPESGRLVSSSYNHFVENYDELYAYAHSGGNDRTYVYDGPTDDRFIGRKDFSVIRGNDFEFYMYMEGFERNFAFSTEGGEDYAFLYDSDADDNFFGRSDYTVMQDADVSYFNYAQGFDRVFGYANAGGTDSAFLTDGTTDDRFYGRETVSIMRDSADTAFYNQVEDFERVTAYSINGGDDHAFLFDSDNDDILTSYFDNTTLNGAADEFYLNARGFNQVVADASGAGSDTAVFYDSTGNDLFFGREDYGYLSGSGFLNRANGFDEVEINGTNGGTNTLNTDALDYALSTLGTWR